MLHKACPSTIHVSMVVKEDWEIVVQSIKDWCVHVQQKGLIKELERCFPIDDLMNEIGIIYFQY